MHKSRLAGFIIDCQTPDLGAEVRRLERLGARRIGMIRGWCVMQAPTGQRFCVARPQRADFAAKANSWPE